MNMRQLRSVGIVLGDVGIVLAILTFIVRLDSIVRLVAVVLIVAGVVLLFRWSALKATEGQKTDGIKSQSASDSAQNEALCERLPPKRISARLALTR